MMDNKNLENTQKVIKLLNELGIRSGLDGFDYIRDIVVRLLEKEGEFVFNARNEYTTTANKFGTSKSRVERSIRYVGINIGNTVNTELVDTIFGAGVSQYGLTNSTLIKGIYNKIRFDM